MPPKALQAYSHPFCRSAAQEHNKENWDQLESHGNQHDRHGRALPMSGTLSRPEGFSFVKGLVPNKKPAPQGEKGWLFKLASAAAGPSRLC